MNNAKSGESLLGIAAVERDTGVSKDTLRVWERRYGFPAPVRNDNGDRLYPMSQVERLRLIRRLLDKGCRPAKVVGASDDELSALLAGLESSRTDAATASACADLEGFIESIRLHRCMELRASLQQMLMKQGLQRFVADTLCHLNAEVGQAWMRGELDVPEEHLYTEQVQNILRGAISTQVSAGGRPRVLLTTFPDELHGLGLLMVEGMLAPEGASCISLGVQTPMSDICSAAVEGVFDIVALSFSGAFPHRQALEGLAELRRLLPSRIALWAGGAAVQGRARSVEGVRLMTSLDDALHALHEWRAAHLT